MTTANTPVASAAAMGKQALARMARNRARSVSRGVGRTLLGERSARESFSASGSALLPRSGSQGIWAPQFCWLDWAVVVTCLVAVPWLDRHTHATPTAWRTGAENQCEHQCQRGTLGKIAARSSSDWVWRLSALAHAVAARTPSAATDHPKQEQPDTQRGLAPGLRKAEVMVAAQTDQFARAVAA